MRKAAIWARVSTDDQETANQLIELRRWAASRDLEVVAEFVFEGSAWNYTGGKGQLFDKKRAEAIDGGRMGHYQVLLIWSLDRVSRRGGEDMLKFVRQVTDTGCELWSKQDPWVESTRDPFVRELMLGIFGTLARFESERRSERTKAGMARAKAEGRLGVRGPDKKPRKKSGYYAAHGR